MQRNLLIAICVAAFGAVALALVGQHLHGMRPCPWCVLQRLIYIAIGLAALVGAVSSLRKPAASLALLLASCGMAAALWQHFVAATNPSCLMTLADQIVSGLGLDRVLPSIFLATASCAEATVSVLGISFDFWSLAMFALLALAAAFVLGVNDRSKRLFA